MIGSTDMRIDNRQFGLVQWFVVVSLLAIGGISAITAGALSRYTTQQMLERDMAVSTEFVNSVVRVQNATSYFYGNTMTPNTPEMEEFFRHVANLPDVIRANVYGFDRSILWSSDENLVGRRFTDNDELEAAFRNAAEVEIEETGAVLENEKQEHAGLPAGVTAFVENYLPIWSEGHRRIVGVVEVYKSPARLLASIEHARLIIWAGSIAAGIVLFVGLTLVVGYANRILREQEALLVEAERMAVVGEMTSAVAHGLRNPLAAIRSCAELALEDDLTPDTRQSIADIVSQTDRLEGWIRSFLTKARRDPEEQHLYLIDDIISDCLEGFRPQMEARDIVWTLEAPGNSPLVAASPTELNHVLNTLLSNGIEAVKHDGRLVVERRIDSDDFVRVAVTDTGPGLQPDAAERLFEPFATGKEKGLGVGLNLARRTLERFGGTLEIANVAGGGARAELRLPTLAGAMA